MSVTINRNVTGSILLCRPNGRFMERVAARHDMRPGSRHSSGAMDFAPEPLARRIPKRGFNNVFAKPLTAVNVAVLNRFEDGSVVDAAALINAGILHACPYGLKVLGNGTVTAKVTVKAAAFSDSAKEKIEQAGGKAEVV